MPFAFFVPHHVLGAPLHFAVCHTACSSSSFLTAAPVSFTAHHSTTPPLHFISPRSLILCCSCAWHPDQTHKPTHRRMHMHFRKPIPMLTGFHFISFRRVSFSTVQSTRCHTFLLAGRPFRLRLLCAANCFCRTSSSQSCTSVHLHTSAASVP